MGRKSARPQVRIHEPETPEQALCLSRLAAGVHADMVVGYIQKLNCPARQKLELLDAVISAAEKRLK